MMNNQIEELSRVTRFLDEISHPDSYRIAKEICKYTNYDISNDNRIFSQLKDGKPWEYIKGSATFIGKQFLVNEYTLIPRIESEQIFEIIKPLVTDDIKKIIDVGTGSGVLGITIAKQYPNLKVTLVDISKDALEVAKKNILNLGVSNVEIIPSDLLKEVNIDSPTLIVANLPYIPTKEYLELDKSVKDFEPRSALDGGLDGLDLIMRLLNQIKGNENIKGAIFEIDPGQEKTLRDLLTKEYAKYSFEFYKDFRGLVRFLKLYR